MKFEENRSKEKKNCGRKSRIKENMHTSKESSSKKAANRRAKAHHYNGAEYKTGALYYR